MAKIESGQLELMPEWVSTEQLVLPVVRLFDGMASGKNLTRTTHDTPSGLEVFIDAARFRRDRHTSITPSSLPTKAAWKCG